MTDASNGRRTDRAERLIKALPSAVYAALIDPAAVAVWLPPEGMKGQVLAFEPHVGGAFRMALIYDSPHDGTRGKTSQDADIVSGRFVALEPDLCVVQETEFQSDNPAFAETMRITWALEPMADGTRASVTCENVPEGISKEDHDAGLRSTLANLAGVTEQSS
ncbi:SRPBCC domain-containing protein [Ensifer adhaerens]|uniref:SRPBCC domain-containing protein n=1 Tax=Ensifer adhaerens TaxID=106592 RepID=UPI001CC02850|nr:SRPBCC domain-containing protein [Ensifer adhaerens]MBZ7924100.1 SRPBCC domain-containing protein [Ensifer adhaerens]UAX92626.1 SRPBCC domain-containing protein [Ensifer adhaerens]UAY00262.1 SRPBCC domain-containing protein [Ensifer adhaerens]UAY07644.1 SRPBCC domain-containing protein [Ensifer adhaerens]